MSTGGRGLSHQRGAQLKVAPSVEIRMPRPDTDACLRPARYIHRRRDLIHVPAVTIAGVDPEFWRGRRVLLTGHTGFKGAWLALWLQRMGADATGVSSRVPTEPSLYQLARVADGLSSVSADVHEVDPIAKALPHA